jgi:hypothetical protein
MKKSRLPDGAVAERDLDDAGETELACERILSSPEEAFQRAAAVGYKARPC